MPAYSHILLKTLSIFGIEGNETILSSELVFDEVLVKKKLSAVILKMLKDDYSGLLNALYRIDLKQELLKKALNKASLADAADFLADEIILRQQKKYA